MTHLTLRVKGIGCLSKVGFIPHLAGTDWRMLLCVHGAQFVP